MQIIELKINEMMGSKPDVIIPCENCWVAGGSIRSWFTREYSPDIDVFFASGDEKQKFKETNNLTTPSYSNYIMEGYCFKNKKQIQLIDLYYKNIKDLFDGFDYNVCQFGYGIFDGEEKIYATGLAIESVLKKKLTVHRIIKQQAFNIFKRAFKYHKKGYIPDTETLEAIATSLSNLSPDDIKKSNAMSPVEIDRNVELIKCNVIQEIVEEYFKSPISQLEL